MELRQGIILTEVEMTAHFRVFIVLIHRCAYRSQRHFVDALLTCSSLWKHRNQTHFVKQKIVSHGTCPVYMSYVVMES